MSEVSVCTGVCAYEQVYVSCLILPIEWFSEVRSLDRCSRVHRWTRSQGEKLSKLDHLEEVKSILAKRVIAGLGGTYLSLVVPFMKLSRQVC